MTTLSIDEWKSAMVNAGFKNVEIHQVAGKENFPNPGHVGPSFSPIGPHNLIVPV